MSPVRRSNSKRSVWKGSEVGGDDTEVGGAEESHGDWDLAAAAPLPVAVLVEGSRAYLARIWRAELGEGWYCSKICVESSCPCPIDNASDPPGCKARKGVKSYLRPYKVHIGGLGKQRAVEASGSVRMFQHLDADARCGDRVETAGITLL